MFKRIYGIFGSAAPYEVFEDAKPFLRWVRAQGIVVGVLSNASYRYRDDILPQLGLRQVRFLNLLLFLLYVCWTAEVSAYSRSWVLMDVVQCYKTYSLLGLLALISHFLFSASEFLIFPCPHKLMDSAFLILSTLRFQPLGLGLPSASPWLIKYVSHNYL